MCDEGCAPVRALRAGRREEVEERPLDGRQPMRVCSAHFFEAVRTPSQLNTMPGRARTSCSSPLTVGARLPSGSWVRGGLAEAMMPEKKNVKGVGPDLALSPLFFSFRAEPRELAHHSHPHTLTMRRSNSAWRLASHALASSTGAGLAAESSAASSSSSARIGASLRRHASSPSTPSQGAGGAAAAAVDSLRQRLADGEREKRAEAFSFSPRRTRARRGLSFFALTSLSSLPGPAFDDFVKQRGTDYSVRAPNWKVREEGAEGAWRRRASEKKKTRTPSDARSTTHLTHPSFHPRPVSLSFPPSRKKPASPTG